MTTGPGALLWALLAAVPLEPLPIALPKPMFEGTPENIKVANLEKPLGRPRDPFLAPKGTVNVARGKPVTASGANLSIGNLEMITDGDKEGGDGHYIELSPYLQSVTIDLKARHVIYAILVWHYHKQARVYSDIVVQAADDQDFIENVRTMFNNDHDNSSGLGVGQDRNYVETAEGKLIDARGMETRYLRLSTNGNHINPLNHYVEVEVYGQPAK